jgi:TolB-like protein/Tfp pilus assembly protein PilF
VRPELIRFGSYEVDLAGGGLRKSGMRVKLRDQSFEVLAILLERPGQIVTREELRRRLWPEDVFVDFDNSLNTAVARLREALNDSAEHPRFIETLPKRGYRFVACVATSPEQRVRLLVLPFANLSGDPAQEYFSDAMTEEIISGLASLAPERLAVIAHTTAMHYKGSQKDIARIGRELGIEYVVEGSVRRTNGRISLSAQLIQVADQMHLLARKYDAESCDIFRMQKAVVQAIAEQFGIAPRPSVRKPTEDFQAYDLYIQGRYHMTKANPEGIAKGKQYLEQAIARDPDLALAYDALAEFYWYLGFLGLEPPKEVCSTGIYYALRALEIDNTLAEAHALLGQYRKVLDYNWPEVQRELARALALNPASPLVRVRYAVNSLMPHGRTAEAVAELELALESDPLSIFTRHWLSIMLLLDRRFDQAVEQARVVLELDPTFYWAHHAMGACYRDRRMYDEAIAAQRRAVKFSGDTPLEIGWLGLVLAQSGNHAEARAVLDRLHAIASRAYVPPSSFAWIHLGLGEIDSAFEWCNRAIDARDDMMMAIKSYVFFDPIRADPRYAALLRRMNLEP